MNIYPDTQMAYRQLFLTLDRNTLIMYYNIKVIQ